MFLEQLVKVELAVAITSFITIVVLLLAGGTIPSVLLWICGISLLLTILTTLFYRIKYKR